MLGRSLPSGLDHSLNGTIVLSSIGLALAHFGIEFLEFGFTDHRRKFHHWRPVELVVNRTDCMLEIGQTREQLLHGGPVTVHAPN